MTRFNDAELEEDGMLVTSVKNLTLASYQEGVARVLAYIESIHAYPKLLDELKWAIKEGII